MKNIVIAVLVGCLVLLGFGLTAGWYIWDHIKARIEEARHAQKAEATETHHIALKGLKQVRVRTTTATLVLEGADRSDIELVAVRIGQGKSKQEAALHLKEVPFKLTQLDGVLQVEGGVAEDQKTAPTLFYQPHDLRLVLRVPRRGAPSIELDNAIGPITLRGVTAPLTAHTEVGDINASDLTGAIKLTTDTGEVKLTGGSGLTDLETDTGDITLSDRPGPRLTAKTGTGALTLRYKTALPGEATLGTETGEISVWLPRNANLRLEAETETGEIDNQLGTGEKPAEVETTGRRLGLTLGAGLGKLSARAATGRIGLGWSDMPEPSASPR